MLAGLKYLLSFGMERQCVKINDQNQNIETNNVILMLYLVGCFYIFKTVVGLTK